MQPGSRDQGFNNFFFILCVLTFRMPEIENIENTKMTKFEAPAVKTKFIRQFEFWKMLLEGLSL